MTAFAAYQIYPVNDSSGIFCHCRPPGTCFRRSVIQDAQFLNRFNVTGMVVACLPVEAALKSTPFCLFDQTCVNKLYSILRETAFFRENITVIALDNSLPSQYSSETKIEDIVYQLMIESITMNASHEQYYNNCQPSICFYTIQKHNNFIYVFTVVLGLVGGLSNVLQVILPRLVTLCNKLIKQLCHCIRCRNQIQPF